MATPTGTSFSNDAGNGYVISDGLIGAPSAADKAAGVLSTQPAKLPNGSVSAGPSTTTPLVITATGSNSQSGSALIGGASVVIVAVVTASTRGIRIPATAGSRFLIFNDTAVNVNVYPATNASIAALSTNTKTTIAAHKGTEFFVRSATHVVTQVGA